MPPSPFVNAGNSTFIGHLIMFTMQVQVTLETHFALLQTTVMAVTVGFPDLRETSVVNMVRRASKKVLFEPGDTRRQWKGEAAACFVLRDRQ
jgi:hypothetical protein